MHGESSTAHPRGWKSAIGHQRKLRSYQVENTFYQSYAKSSQARVPQCYGYTEKNGSSLLVLEDLDASGFPIRREEVNEIQFENCISWLAQFHADFMSKEPLGLWETGTYWHLDTRPDEWEAMKDSSLKNAAHLIDQKLKNTSFQTLVHGDAKLANFCFGAQDQIAGLDFQYIGGGCGMKDLAYFVGSCMGEEECEKNESFILNHYFQELEEAMGQNVAAIEQEWRPLYCFAWADFHRFLKGWSPSHWKINDYSERVCREVLKALGETN